jgi:hypothetical protein
LLSNNEKWRSYTDVSISCSQNHLHTTTNHHNYISWAPPCFIHPYSRCGNMPSLAKHLNFYCQIIKNEGVTPLHPFLAAKITYTQQPTSRCHYRLDTLLQNFIAK